MTLLNLDLRFITEKQFLILSSIDSSSEIYALQISRITGITYDYLVSVLDEFNKQGLIIQKHSGRTNFLKLTDRGKEYLHAVKKVHSLFKEEKKIVKSIDS